MFHRQFLEGKVGDVVKLSELPSLCSDVLFTRNYKPVLVFIIIECCEPVLFFHFVERC